MAFGIEGFNINETPAFQRQLQQINALPGYHQALARNAMKHASAMNASQQFDKYMRSRAFAEERRGAEAGLKLAKQKLSLDRQSSDQLHQFRIDKLGLQQEALERDSADDFLTGILGLGTYGYGLYNDRQERARRQKEKDWMELNLGRFYLPAE